MNNPIMMVESVQLVGIMTDMMRVVVIEVVPYQVCRLTETMVRMVLEARPGCIQTKLGSNSIGILGTEMTVVVMYFVLEDRSSSKKASEAISTNLTTKEQQNSGSNY